MPVCAFCLCGSRVSSARVAFHAVRRSPGQGNGSYRADATEDREEDSSTVTLVLGLGAINGLPPAVYVPRPRALRRRCLPSPQATRWLPREGARLRHKPCKNRVLQGAKTTRKTVH